MSSSRYVTAFNTTSGPVLIDGDGRQLGGREYGCVRRLADEVRRGIDRGELIVIADPGDLDNARPDAADAIRATREANGEPADGVSGDEAPKAEAAPKNEPASPRRGGRSTDEKGS